MLHNIMCNSKKFETLLLIRCKNDIGYNFVKIYRTEKIGNLKRILSRDCFYFRFPKFVRQGDFNAVFQNYILGASWFKKV